MARPSTSILIKKNVIQQFHSWGIKSIINLQTPKEHSSCGPPLEESGFTYDPAIFMENDIFYYNFTWKDYGNASLQSLLSMVKVLAFAVKEGRVAIHCHAGLGRTGVLIACYLVYILRVKANDAINFIRLKRPGSVQTRGQILCIQEFAQYILPQCIVYNIKKNIFSRDPSQTHHSKDKKSSDLSLSKFLRYQRIILHGYEERSLKNIPKIVYRICERILLLSNCWCDEFAIGNVPFTKNFLVTKLNFKNRKNSISPQHTETGSQQTLSNYSQKEVGLTTPTEDNSRILGELSARSNGDSSISENGSQIINAAISSSDSSTELLNDIYGGMIDENLRENKCFQLLSQMQCGSPHEIAQPYSVQEVVDALLLDHNSLDESTRKYIRQFEADLNSSQTTWSRLKTEKKLAVLSGLLYDWLESLKTPVITREDLSNIVIYNNRPELCLQKLNIDSQYVLEFLMRVLLHLQPMETSIILNLLKRFAASLTQRTISLRNIRLPRGKDFQKLREGTLKCLLNFLYSLYNTIEANRTSSAVSTKFYEICSGSSEILSPNDSDDDSDVECSVNHVIKQCDIK